MSIAAIASERKVIALPDARSLKTAAKHPGEERFFRIFAASVPLWKPIQME